MSYYKQRGGGERYYREPTGTNTGTNELTAALLATLLAPPWPSSDSSMNPLVTGSGRRTTDRPHLLIAGEAR